METSHRHLSPTDLFSAAVNSVFQNWQAFKFATSMRKKSDEVAKWVVQVTETCLHENNNIDDGNELGEWIGDILDHEFDLVVEDGSLQDIGNQLINYWKMYQTNKLLELAEILDQKMTEVSTISLPTRLNTEDSSSEDEASDDEEMDTDSQPGPSQISSSERNSSIPDVDGWITVKKNKKR